MFGFFVLMNIRNFIFSAQILWNLNYLTKFFAALRLGGKQIASNHFKRSKTTPAKAQSKIKYLKKT